MIKVKCNREMKNRRDLETAESSELLVRSGGAFAGCPQYSTQVEQLGTI
jgi:hypothetical protein